VKNSEFERKSVGLKLQHFQRNVWEFYSVGYWSVVTLHFFTYCLSKGLAFSVLQALVIAFAENNQNFILMMRIVCVFNC